MPSINDLLQRSGVKQSRRATLVPKKLSLSSQVEKGYAIISLLVNFPIEDAEQPEDELKADKQIPEPLPTVTPYRH